MVADGHLGYTKMAITSQPVCRSTCYLVLGWGFRGRPDNFEISKIQDGGIHALLSRATLVSAGLSCSWLAVLCNQLWSPWLASHTVLACRISFWSQHDDMIGRIASWKLFHLLLCGLSYESDEAQTIRASPCSSTLNMSTQTQQQLSSHSPRKERLRRRLAVTCVRLWRARSALRKINKQHKELKAV